MGKKKDKDKTQDEVLDVAQGEALNEDARKRLEKLESEWEKRELSYWGISFSCSDLRLLLEHSRPVQALIRQIACGQMGAGEPAPGQAQGDDALQAELDAMRKQLQDLREEREQLQRALEQARQQAAACQMELDRLRQHPPLGEAGEVLAFLCQRSDLQAFLGLEGLAMDVEGLVRMVAVLAQKDNVRRLLERLGEAAVRRRAPMTAQERALLAAAVNWLNYNWRTRPYRLVDPQPYAPFDFNTQNRANYTPTGETIVQVLAPGLQNGQLQWELKPIVETSNR